MATRRSTSPPSGRRRLALAGSIALHAVLGLALLGIRSLAPRDPPAPPQIELVELEPTSVVELVELSSGGGGTPGTGADSTATTAPRAKIAPRSRDLDPPTRRERRPATPRSLAETLDDLATDARLDAGAAGAGGGDGGDGGGRGGGHGRGIGRGVGEGLGALAATGAALPTPPAAPPASKARPARLIYPSREREVVDGQAYVARVMVDAEGFVVGARLTQRLGGSKDDDAASLIFRFRYAPALDDDGRPIWSEVDQQFLVGP